MYIEREWQWWKWLPRTGRCTADWPGFLRFSGSITHGFGRFWGTIYLWHLASGDVLQNVLRATTACTFSTSQLPKVVRQWCVLDNGVFCTFWLRNVLRATTACTFSCLIWPAGSAPAALASLLFDPPNTVFRDFPTFSRICIFFLLNLSPLWSSLFYSPLLSASAQLCFSFVHIVGSLTSKLPSVIESIVESPINHDLWIDNQR